MKNEKLKFIMINYPKSIPLQSVKLISYLRSITSRKHFYMKALQNIHPFYFILVATILEVIGDALIRMSIYNHQGIVRLGLMIIGSLLFFGYGSSLNLAPVKFGQVVGLYIATLFVVWQVLTFLIFKSTPSTSVLVGGSFIVLGGLIVTFWK